MPSEMTTIVSLIATVGGLGAVGIFWTWRTAQTQEASQELERERLDLERSRLEAEIQVQRERLQEEVLRGKETLEILKNQAKDSTALQQKQMELFGEAITQVNAGMQAIVEALRVHDKQAGTILTHVSTIQDTTACTKQLLNDMRAEAKT
jgi:hypothetical protein